MDRPVERRTWEVYYVFQQYVIHYIERLKTQVSKYTRCQNECQNDREKLEKHPLKDYAGFKQSRYFCLRLVFLKAMKKANQIHQEGRTWPERLFSSPHSLLNIWTHLEGQVASPYSHYSSDRHVDDPFGYWRSYEVNEAGSRSVFLPMERLKLGN